MDNGDGVYSKQTRHEYNILRMIDRFVTWWWLSNNAQTKKKICAFEHGVILPVELSINRGLAIKRTEICDCGGGFGRQIIQAVNAQSKAMLWSSARLTTAPIDEFWRIRSFRSSAFALLYDTLNHLLWEITNFWDNPPKTAKVRGNPGGLESWDMIE